MSGAELIAAERERQVSVEGWTSVHDDEHDEEELAKAAACYAFPRFSLDPRITIPEDWPWGGSWWKSESFEPLRASPFRKIAEGYEGRPSRQKKGSRHEYRQGRIRDLAKAGALLAAEIDRLQRVVACEEVPDAH